MTNVYDGRAVTAESPARSPHFLAALLRRDAPPMSLVIDDRPQAPLATTVEPAFDSTSRKRGLLGRSTLAQNTAIVLAPCSAIHTFGMRFPIDVIFAARDGRVLKIRRAMGASSASMALRAFAAIEMAAGEAERHGLRVGERLSLIASV